MKETVTKKRRNRLDTDRQAVNRKEGTDEGRVMRGKQRQ